jgi:ABC-type Fe3+-hydroxamate transport system substrate-binding protein
MARADTKNKTPEMIKAIMIGDRLVDVAYHLGVVPEAMSVRGGLWPMVKKELAMVQVLGCPRCVSVRNKTIVAETARKSRITRIIVEKHPHYCLYMPDVDPSDVVPLIAGKGLTIEYVDFSQGIEPAIRQAGRLLDRTSRAEALIASYRKSLTTSRSTLPKEKLGKNVVIIRGVYQIETSKGFLMLEAPGYYADRFLLEPLGCTNANQALVPENAKPNKGHYILPKLGSLARADPDVIIMTGDAFPVQRALFRAINKNPQLAEVPAVRNLAIYSLPLYVGSGVIEYPHILRQWAVALMQGNRTGPMTVEQGTDM